MYRDRIAEFLLESVTTRERAATTLGDHRESAATRGEVWFWSNVLGTTASLLWRTMVADKRRMLGLALRAWFLSLVVGAAVTIAGIFIVGMVVGLDRPVHVGFTIASLVPVLFGSLAITQFLVGRWIAKRAPGRELPACLAIAILQSAVSWAVPFALMSVSHHIDWRVLALESSRFLLTDVFCFLGALSVRRRATNRGAHA